MSSTCIFVTLLLSVTISHVTFGFPLDISKVSLREGRGQKVTNTMLEKVNIDTYLRNTRAVSQQIKCILKDGPCDAVGKEIKRLMPIVLHDKGCSDCTPNQLQKIRKVIDHLKINYPDDWAVGVKRFGDPDDL